MADEEHPVLQRLRTSERSATAFDVLTTELSGSDLTSFLLGVAQRRVDRVETADVLRQYGRDRFVAPGPVDALTMATIELAALTSADNAGFDTVTLAPIAPFGTHATLGGTPQNNVVSTMRGSEVAADPTNMLALEAATRRRALLTVHPRSTDVVSLASVQRVTRAQNFSGPRSYAHFSLLGMVSAGRDQGNLAFEVEHVGAHVRALTSVLAATTTAPITVALSPFRTDAVPATQQLVAELSSSRVTCELWPEREHARGYYGTLCFKISVQVNGEKFELGDGGDVTWTQGLLNNRKERLVIGGLGLERLAMLVAEGRDASLTAASPTAVEGDS